MFGCSSLDGIQYIRSTADLACIGFNQEQKKQKTLRQTNCADLLVIQHINSIPKLTGIYTVDVGTMELLRGYLYKAVVINCL